MIENNLISFSTSLTSNHLSLAVEGYNRFKDDPISRNHLSIILHAYCGLEAAINLIGFEIYFNPDSHRYINETKRDFALKRILKSWNISMSCLEKIDIVLSLSSDEIAGKLRNELIELNNLRNWLSHGFPYRTTLLVDTDATKTGGSVIDYEHGVDWKKKFPTTKFNAPNELNFKDSEKVLQIVFSTLIKISSATGEIFYISIYKDNWPSIKIISKESTVAEFLNLDD